MKNFSIFLTLIAAAVLFSPACKKKTEETEPVNNETLLEKNYSGSLHLLLKNTYPAFEETTSIPVSIDKAGKMTFGIGGLQYNAEDNNGQSKIQREGELIISPNGSAFKDQDKIMFAVDENTMVTETFKVWVWDGSTWLLTVNQTVSETWKNGLSFPLDEAETSGSVVEVSNANGTARWTLTVSPEI